MKNLIWLVVVVLAGVFLFKGEKEEVRIRIIPNSNEEADLEVKDQVKKEVLKFLETIQVENYEELKRCLNEKYLMLEENLQAFGKVKVEFVNHKFPVKTYNGKVMEAKVYKTLLITINSGNGDNWWASLYPSYLGISTDEKVEYESFIFNLFKKKSQEKV